MFTNLGKLLFPHLPRDLRRSKMRVVFLTLITSLVVSLLMIFWIFRKVRH